MAVKILPPSEFPSPSEEANDWILNEINKNLRDGKLYMIIERRAGCELNSKTATQVMGDLEAAGWGVLVCEAIYPDRPCAEGYLELQLHLPPRGN